MKNNIAILFYIFIILLAIVGCKEEQVATPIQPLPDNQYKVTIKQGAWGDVVFLEGNFMPSYGGHSNGGTIKPVEREIHIYEATKVGNVERDSLRPEFLDKINSKYVTKVVSDKDGFFQISLEVGMYSCFIKEDSLYWVGGGNGEGVLMPVDVKLNTVTKIQISIDYKAVY